MQYSQEIIDQLRVKMPFKGKMEISKRTGLPYTTVCDALNTYREGGKPKYIKRKLKIYSTAIEILNENGITLN